MEQMISALSKTLNYSDSLHKIQNLKIKVNYLGKGLYELYILTHVSRETLKSVIGKQCRPRSDATERVVWSVHTVRINYRHFYKT